MSFVSLQYQIEDRFKALEEAAEKGSFRGLNHAAASIRRSIIASIDISPSASAPGTPVHSRKGKFKRATLYSVDRLRQEAVIGLVYSKVKTSGEPHEKGIPYMGVRYPKRPTVLPGLLRAVPRISGGWQGSLG